MGCHSQNKVRRMSLSHRDVTWCKILKTEQREEEVHIGQRGGWYGVLEPRESKEDTQTEGGVGEEGKALAHQPRALGKRVFSLCLLLVCLTVECQVVQYSGSICPVCGKGVV